MASKRRKKRVAQRKGIVDVSTHRNKKCYSKQPFKSREEAEHNLSRLMASPFYDGRPMNVYICSLSDADEPHYHFGHSYEANHGQELAYTPYTAAD